MAKQFNSRNQAFFKKGYSAFVPEKEKWGGRDKYEIHHVKPINEGGAVYDIGNLRVLTPKRHIEIHSKNGVNKMTDKKTISDYTEMEFLEFAKKVCSADYPTEEEADNAVREFIRLSEHPDGTDIIFYPPATQEDSPEGLVKQIKEWRAQNGKPGFKQG